MLIGYARVSTDDQNLEGQLADLRRAGVGTIYTEKASGAKDDRPELAKLLQHVRAGDTVVVTRLDRLGRSLPHLIHVVYGRDKDDTESLRGRGVGFRSLSEGIDTTTDAGELTFNIFGALAQYERRLIQSRTRSGLAAARARGKVGGRKAKLTPSDVKRLQREYNSGDYTVAEIAQHFKVSRPTVYAYLRQAKQIDAAR